MIIRSETPDDEDAVHRITAAAFATVSHASGTEAQIIRELRKDGDLTIALIAKSGGEIVGHIAFSPVAIGGWHERLVPSRPPGHVSQRVAERVRQRARRRLSHDASGAGCKGLRASRQPLCVPKTSSALIS